MSLETARNIAIIVLLALVVWLVPGGGEGASFISQLLNAIFIVLIALGCGILYRSFRGEIFSLGDTWRLALYAAVGVAIVTIAASRRLFDTGAGRGAVVRARRGRVVHAVPRLAALPLVHVAARARRPAARPADARARGSCELRASHAARRSHPRALRRRAPRDCVTRSRADCHTCV